MTRRSCGWAITGQTRTDGGQLLEDLQLIFCTTVTGSLLAAWGLEMTGQRFLTDKMVDTFSEISCGP